MMQNSRHPVLSTMSCMAMLSALLIAGPIAQPAAEAAPDAIAPPAVNAVSQRVASAAGGSRVTLEGSGFTTDATVSVGGRPATVLSASPDHLVITVPAGAPGVARIQVRTSAGQSTSTSRTALAYIDQIPGARPRTVSSTGATGKARMLPRAATGTVADPNLALCITDQLGLAPTALPSSQQLRGLTELFCTGRGITRLDGIAELPSLKTLDLGGNTITDIAPLATLADLTELGLQDNEISDLSPLSGLTRLSRLDLWSTPVESLQPLHGLTALTRLNVDDTRVSSLQSLSGLRSLIALGADYTGVSDLTPLRAATGLQDLQLWHTGVWDLTPLAGLTALKALDVSATRVSTLKALSRLTRLETLSTEDDAVSDVSALSGLSRLYSLNLNGNRVANVAPLAGFTSLQWLFLQRNRIVDLSPLRRLSPNSIEAQGQQAAAPVASGKFITLTMADRHGAGLIISGANARYASGRITFIRASTTALSYRSVDGQFSGSVVASCSFNVPLASGDGTGDRIADIYGVTRDGRLRYFRGSATRGLSALADPWPDAGTATALTQTPDLNSDGRSDLLTREADGRLTVRSGLGNGYTGSPRIIGNRWNSMSLITSVGRLNGSTPMLLARQTSTGNLVRYTLTSRGLAGTTVIGHGWGSMRAIAGVGDWNGDKRDDIVALRNDGTLWLYTSSAAGTPNRGVLIGKGWRPFNALFSPGDLSGDGRADLVGIRTDGTAMAYTRTRNGFSGPRIIGRGFQSYRVVG